MSNRKTFDLRTKSVSKPTAQTTTMCEPGRVPGDTGQTVEAALEKVRKQSKSVRAVVELQARYGLRISEVLNIKWNHIKDNQVVVIKGLKGSGDRIVHVFENWHYLSFCRKYQVNPFESLNRFFLYRLYKKVGFIYKSGNSGKYSITHSFRHKVVDQLRKNDIKDETTAKFIGHKSVVNTANYGK